MRLSGKIALITGGGTGIGQAAAQALAQEGAQVIVTGRRAAKLEETCASIQAPRPVRSYAADVANRHEVNDLVSWVKTEFGPIDIVVNNAGINVANRTLAELSPDDWDMLMQVNATGAFNVIHAVLPEMRARRDGVIINISSLAGVRASNLGGAAYSASKHAMSALTRVIAIEDKDNGIRATNLCPGEVNTPILDERPVKVSDAHKAQILQPEDVAAAVLFIATLPPRAHVPELLIKPTTQLFV
ncbi:MAG: SDR family oxidoreductase [Caldilineaceae bacterium]|nr:SDR family oxidoreductase [Caldilineaceae bacterium]